MHYRTKLLEEVNQAVKAGKVLDGCGWIKRINYNVDLFTYKRAFTVLIFAVIRIANIRCWISFFYVY